MLGLEVVAISVFVIFCVTRFFTQFSKPQAHQISTEQWTELETLLNMAASSGQKDLDDQSRNPEGFRKMIEKLGMGSRDPDYTR